MKNKKIVVGFIILMLIALGVASAIIIQLDEPRQPTTETSSVDMAEQPALAEVIRFTAEPGKSILEQLEHKAAIETKNSAYGVYVDAINGKRGGEEGKYWAFYIDGEMAQIGADTYITEGGELIEWKFE